MKRTNRGCVIITRRKMPARNCETERGGEEGALGVLFKSRNEEQRRTDNEEIGDSCVKSETESQASNPCSSRGGVRVPKNSFTSVVERKKKKQEFVPRRCQTKTALRKQLLKKSDAREEKGTHETRSICH